MTKLSEHKGSKSVKLLLVGDSGTGKTSSLLSLVKADYKLKILDLDNGLDSLVMLIRRDCPEKLDHVDYETRRDKYKASPLGPIISGTPKAFVDSINLLTKWSDGSVPAEWDANTVMVIDSLTMLGKAAYAWSMGMNPTAKDPRQWYFAAQQALEHVIALLTTADFRPNVVLITHVQYRENADGTTQGYATAIGSALGPTIPAYFNTMVLTTRTGFGKQVRRIIQTVPTAIMDLKNPAPFSIDAQLPLDTGLATIFATLKGGE